MQFDDHEGNLVETLDREPVYILCHPYSNDPINNFQRCVDTVHFLWSRINLKMFSPILHTHQYDFTLRKQNQEYGEDYYQWDLKIYGCFKKNAVILFPSNYTSSKGCILEHTWAKSNNRKILYFDE